MATCYEDPSSTYYEELRSQRAAWVYANAYVLSREIEILVKKEPSWPQVRKDKRKNFKL